MGYSCWTRPPIVRILKHSSACCTRLTTEQRQEVLESFKVLFTTDGFMDALAALNEDEKLDVIDLACKEGSGANADEIEMGFL